MSEEALEMNRQTAIRLTSEIAFCKCEHCQKAVSDRIFTALQIAQARGKAIAEFRADIANCNHANPCSDREPSECADSECPANIKTGDCKHTIGTSVDEDGCCFSCGEDLNYIGDKERFIVVSDLPEYTVFDTKEQRDLYPTKSGNRDYACKECDSATAGIIAAALNCYLTTLNATKLEGEL